MSGGVGCSDLDPDRDGAVIGQGNGHVRAELPGLDRDRQGGEGACEVFIKRAGVVRFGGLGKPRTGAARCVGGEGELADHKGGTAGLGEA